MGSEEVLDGEASAMAGLPGVDTEGEERLERLDWLTRSLLSVNRLYFFRLAASFTTAGRAETGSIRENVCVADLTSSSITCWHDCTFGDLLVQSLEEDALINVLHMDEVGVIGVDGLIESLKLLQRERDMWVKL